VLLPLTAPMVDVYALYGLFFLDPVTVTATWAGFTAVQMATAAYALHLDGERYGPLWSLPLQQIVYRQLMYLVVIQSTVTALLGGRLRWHRMVRTGAATARARAENRTHGAPLPARPAGPYPATPPAGPYRSTPYPATPYRSTPYPATPYRSTPHRSTPHPAALPTQIVPTIAVHRTGRTHGEYPGGVANPRRRMN